MADKEVEKVREKMAREIGQHAENCPWEDCSANEKDAAYRSADFIMSFPELCVKADDQSLPTTPFYPRIRQLEAMQITQQDMLKANFVKIVPKGNYEQPKTKDG